MKKRTILLSLMLIICLAFSSFTTFGTTKQYRAFAAELPPETGSYINYENELDSKQDEHWFSEHFRPVLDRYITFHDPLPSTKELEDHLNMYKEYYMRGARCFSYIPILLNAGVSFEGITLHMRTESNVVYSTSSAYPTHLSIGSEARPFDGIFDGNGCTVYLEGGIASNGIFTGFFGGIENATIMNLTVASQNEISIGATGQEYVGGITAWAKDSKIINCVNDINLADLDGTPEFVGAIAGYAEKTEIINCIDKTNFNSGDGLVGGIHEGDDEAETIINSISYQDWDLMSENKQISLIKKMNNNVYNFLDSYEGLIGEYFWGIGRNEYPLFNALEPIFDEIFLFKKSMREDIDYFYEDTCDFLGEDPIVINQATLSLLQEILDDYLSANVLKTAAMGGGKYEWDALGTINKLYKVLTTELKNLSVDSEDNLQDFVDFVFEAISIKTKARDIFDEIYWIWAEYDALDYELRLKEFAFEMIYFSYDDNRTFMLEMGEDRDEVISAITALDDRYSEIIGHFEEEFSPEASGELNSLSIFESDGTIKAAGDFFDEISNLIQDAIDEFDDMYWELADVIEGIDIEAFRQELREELAEAFTAIKRSRVNAKMQKAYDAALEAIDDTDFTDWNSFSYNLSSSVNKAKAEFDKIQAEWKSRTILISTVSGILAILIIGAGVSLFIILRMRRKYTFDVNNAVNEYRGRKAKKVQEKAEAAARLLEIERQKKDLIAQEKREKMQAVSKLEEEKAKLEQERIRLAMRFQQQVQEREAVMLAQKEKIEELEKKFEYLKKKQDDRE